MLEISGVTVSYGSTVAVEGVSFRVESGDIVGVVGPNGAGKTSLFKTILGFESQDFGSIDFNGKAISEVGSANIGYLAESPFLYDFFTPLEMLMFEISLKQATVSDEHVCEMMELLGLEKHKDTPISKLSQGFKKRVAIASAFICNPSLVILDEPLNALDIQTVIVLKQLIEQFSTQGAHLLLSSHVLTFFNGLVSKVVFLDHGKLRHISSSAADDAEEVYKRLYMTS